MKRRLAVILIAASSASFAQPSQPPLEGDARTQWFRDAKFGMFIHWGAYSVIGRHEWARNIFHIPQDEYDEYARQFNPVNYDPNAWVDLAQDAGMKYMVITSKHHDGFDMFRSDAGDYGIKMTSYSGDPLKMLADACKAKGMRLGFYHSIMDWHHRDYRPRRDWESPDPKAGGDLPRYIDYMEAQLKELLTRYGDVAVLWFDGEWEHTTQEMRSDEVYDMIRKLQPNTLINDRLFKRQPGNKADFGTPEQYVPSTGLRDPGGKPILWESCVTIDPSSWGYNRYGTEFRTNRDLIRMLVEVASKGGNLLLNVGPKPDGTIQPDFVSRLRAMGAWMKVNNQAIYGTSASPFTRLPFFGRATVKGDTLYLHVFQWPKDGKVRVPAVQNRPVSAHLLGSPGGSLPFLRESNDIVISVPAKAPDDIASVIALKLDGPPRIGEYRIAPDSDGAVNLPVESSEIETSFEQRAKLENALGHVFLTSWSKPQDVPYWEITVPASRKYRVEISYAATKPALGSPFVVSAGSATLPGTVKKAEGEWVFHKEVLGDLTLPAGAATVKVKLQTKDKGGVDVMQLESLRLKPVRE